MVTTVAQNKSKYHIKDYNRAKAARELQVLIGRPTTSDFLQLSDDGLLHNSDVTRDDIVNVEHIWGLELGSIKGKTTSRKSKYIRTDFINLPKEIMLKYIDVTLCVDVMYVNRIPILISLSKWIKFITCTALDNRKQDTLVKTLLEIYFLYKKRGFNLVSLFADGGRICT